MLKIRFLLHIILSETNQKQNQAVATSTSTSSTNSNLDVDTLALSIKAQTEQNQLLRRVFAELEKELRALTDNRIALEIKLDYLNTATQSANQTVNSQVTPAAVLSEKIVPITSSNLITSSSIGSSTAQSNNSGTCTVTPSIKSAQNSVVHGKINI